MRCARCGRRVGIYLNEVSGRYVAHVIPLALHRAVLNTQSSEQEFLSHYAADVTVPQPKGWES